MVATATPLPWPLPVGTGRERSSLQKVAIWQPYTWLSNLSPKNKWICGLAAGVTLMGLGIYGYHRWRHKKTVAIPRMYTTAPRLFLSPTGRPEHIVTKNIRDALGTNGIAQHICYIRQENAPASQEQYKVITHDNNVAYFEINITWYGTATVKRHLVKDSPWDTSHASLLGRSLHLDPHNSF